jgi:hypothetical protein
VSEERQTVELPDFSDLAPQQVGSWDKPVWVGKRRCVIREPDADAECAYKSALTKGTRYSVTGKEAEASGRQFEAELVLVQRCLWELYEHKGGERKERQFTMAEVKALPSRVHVWLFEQADKLRPADKETPEQLKARRAEIDLKLKAAREAERNGEEGDPFENSPGSTTATST